MDPKNLKEKTNKVIGWIVSQVLSIKDELVLVSRNISSTFKSEMPQNKKREQLLEALVSLSMKSKASVAGSLIIFISFFSIGGGTVVANIESDKGIICTSSCGDIEGLNLSDKTWANFKFSGVNFLDVNFENVKFYGTKFENVSFRDTNFIFDQTLDIGELSNVQIESSAIEVSNPPDGGQYFYISGENISLSDSSLKGLSINLASPENNVSFDNVMLQESTVIISTNELITSYQERLEGHFWANLGHENIKVNAFQNGPEKRNVNLDPLQRKGLDNLISELRFSQESKELAKITKIYVNECKISALDNLVIELAECNKDLGTAVEAFIDKVNNVETSIAHYSKDIRDSINVDFVWKAMIASKDYFKLRAYIDEGSKAFVELVNSSQLPEFVTLILMEYVRDNMLINDPKLRKLAGEYFVFSTEENFDKISPLKWKTKPSLYQIPLDIWDRDDFCKATVSLDKSHNSQPFELTWFYENPNHDSWLKNAKSLKNQWQKFAENSSIAEIKNCLEVLPNLNKAIWERLGLTAGLIDRVHGNTYINNSYNGKNVQISEVMFDGLLPLSGLDKSVNVIDFTNGSIVDINKLASDKIICINSFDEAVKPLRPNEWKALLSKRKLSKAKCGKLDSVADYYMFVYGSPAPE